jgi:hypothetical protein
MLTLSFLGEGKWVWETGMMVMVVVGFLVEDSGGEKKEKKEMGTER